MSYEKRIGERIHVGDIRVRWSHLHANGAHRTQRKGHGKRRSEEHVEHEDAYLIDAPLELREDLQLLTAGICWLLVVLALCRPERVGEPLERLLPDAGRGERGDIRPGDRRGIALAGAGRGALPVQDRDLKAALHQARGGRQPDDAGWDGWADALENGSRSGSQVAAGFVFSKEFKKK